MTRGTKVASLLLREFCSNRHKSKYDASTTARTVATFIMKSIGT